VSTLTFGLAYVAYVLLCADVVLHARGRPKRALTVGLAAVLVAHVALVWGWRFGWSPSAALAKGVAGFVVFHAAFAAIVLAAVAPEPWSGRLLYASLPVASMGAIGAALRYDYVRGLRVPLIVALAVTVILLARTFTGPRPRPSTGP